MGRPTDVQRLVKICERFPEVVLDPHNQHTAFKVRSKTFAWHVVDEHGDGRVAFICKARAGHNEALASAEPARFFLPKYMAHHGWVGVYLDVGATPWNELRELATDAYVLTAPKKLAAQVER